MKQVRWTGSSLSIAKALPEHVKAALGYHIDYLQHGYEPTGCRSLLSFKPPINEVRICDDAEYVFYYLSVPATHRYSEQYDFTDVHYLSNFQLKFRDVILILHVCDRSIPTNNESAIIELLKQQLKSLINVTTT